MVKKMYIPDRGDVVWVDLNPTRGHEQSKTRPALVLSPKSYNKKTHLALMCPITSKVKGYPFEVLVAEKNIQGAILADQLRSLDWSVRDVRLIQRANRVTVLETLKKAGLLIAE